jgi:hypothetical protein
VGRQLQHLPGSGLTLGAPYNTSSCIGTPSWMVLAMIRVRMVGTGSIPMQHGGENTGFIQ